MTANLTTTRVPEDTVAQDHLASDQTTNISEDLGDMSSIENLPPKEWPTTPWKFAHAQQRMLAMD